MTDYAKKALINALMGDGAARNEPEHNALGGPAHLPPEWLWRELKDGADRSMWHTRDIGSMNRGYVPGPRESDQVTDLRNDKWAWFLNRIGWDGPRQPQRVNAPEILRTPTDADFEEIKAFVDRRRQSGNEDGSR